MRFYLLFIVSAFTAMAAAQSHCDPLTQYEKDGVCCNMCGPGNRMLEQSTCQDPVCENCGKNEYMDEYTKSDKCHPQPYCDPNKNFQVATHKSDRETICFCKEGFHYSSSDWCIQHTKCEPGSGVQTKGDQTHDTVCQRCPYGTFSNESSSDDVCVKWTVCGLGYEVETTGTEKSDTTCVKKSRDHMIVIIIVLVIVVGLMLAGIIFYIHKKKSGYFEMREKVYACLGCQETKIIAQDEQKPMTERSTPEETEDEESMLDHGVTENGNVLTQEYGKMEVLSRQESQTQESCSV